MINQFGLEVYSASSTLKPQTFHVFKFQINSLTSDFQVEIGRACRFILNSTRFAVGAFHDDNFVYTTEKEFPQHLSADYTLIYEGTRSLPLEGNSRLYQSIISYYIRRNLMKIKIYGKQKYSVQDSILCHIYDEKKSTVSTEDGIFGKVYLKRKFDFSAQVKPDGRVFLWVTNSSAYVPNKTIFDLWQEGVDLSDYEGQLEVKNNWSKKHEVGTFMGLSELSISDDYPKLGKSIKEYHVGLGRGQLFNSIPDNTKVAMVKLRNHDEAIPYVPHQLKPVIDMPFLSQHYPNYFDKFKPYIRRNMATRIEEDRLFLADIGILSELGEDFFFVPEFLTEETFCEELGYERFLLDDPILVCKKGAKLLKTTEKFKMPSVGLYHKNNKPIRVYWVYPPDFRNEIAQYYRNIRELIINGGGENRYLTRGFIDMDFSPPLLSKPYDFVKETGVDSYGCVSFAKSVIEEVKVNNADIIFCVLPKGDDITYKTFKKQFSFKGIASQMFQIDTVKEFNLDYAKQKTDEKLSSDLARKCWKTVKSLFVETYIGVASKTGSIPWILRDMAGEVDCFVGLDVGVNEANVRYPACSVSFDRFGGIINCYKPNVAMKTEKIHVEALTEIFDNVLALYEKSHHNKAKSIVIHRDGFSHEDDLFYEEYFIPKGIEYNIVEVRKNVSKRMLWVDEFGSVHNPAMGNCLINREEHVAILTTTSISEGFGAPQPILIEKKCGSLPLEVLVSQIYSLSQIHYGSTKSLRLPITTSYADEICKSKDFFPSGEFKGLLFL